MKLIQLLLLFGAVSYCYTDECTNNFKQMLETKCVEIDSSKCRVTDLDITQRCFPKNICGDAKDRTTCETLIPADFHKKKCFWTYNTEIADNECIEISKKCNDYNKVNGIEESITGDDCSSLDPGNTNKRCVLYYDNGKEKCESHYKLCSNVDNRSECEKNIPNEKTKKCKWNSSITPSECQDDVRVCEDKKYEASESICSGLPLLQNTGTTKCIYSRGICIEAFKSCHGYYSSNDRISCEGGNSVNDGNGNMPLNDAQYDINYKCKYFSDDCKAELRTCEEYKGNNASICEGLIASDSNKRCIYDENANGNKCREEYKTCELYNSNKIEKKRKECEDIILLEKGEKCVYIKEEDKCETIRHNYETCDEYEGKDRKICESIVSPTDYIYCVLDKDSKCISRPPFCHEVIDDKDCIYFAKATDINKKCAYNYNTLKCYEEYIKCEDYIGKDYSECNSIRLYNGNKCEYDNSLGRCITINKVCSDAETEEECKLIAKTGVIDPERKVCDYIGSSCIENYKYCSDFRIFLSSDDISTISQSMVNEIKGFCENIKPYDELGEKIDIYSKCIFEEDVGCQRVPLDCKDAKNPLLCNLISPKIKDNSVKHCVFDIDNDECKTEFKKCKDVTKTRDYLTSKCTDNIIENYVNNKCKDDDTECVEQNICITESSYKYLCESFNSSCKYDVNNDVCKTKEKQTCTETIFYTDSEKNEDICKSMNASKPYKICTLKEDKSGCEEIYRNLPQSSQNNNEENSDGILSKGKYLVIILLCLLI